MKTNSYVLTEAYSYHMGNSDALIIPDGAFVCPLSEKYIPKHILEDIRFRHIDIKIYTFCYTRFGILPIPKRLIRVK